MTELVAPSLDRYEAWKACMEDFGDAHDDLHGSGYWYLPDGLRFDTDRDTLEALVAILRRLRRETDRATTMPSDFLWIVDGNEMVGFIRVTYRLNAYLLEQGGHIGYSIRPGRRREGHARRALGLALGGAASTACTACSSPATRAMPARRRPSVRTAASMSS